MRIARLAAENPRTQGPRRRAWYQQHNPEHLRHIAALVERALRARGPDAPARAVALGAGACTELPLERLARALDPVLLVDVDVAGMAHARDTLPAAVRSRVDLLQADVTGGVSAALAAEVQAQPWADLAHLGSARGAAALDTAAACLERCPVPNPPAIPGLAPGGYSLVISSLLLTQLYSLPLLDVVDSLTLHAPIAAGQREAWPRYVAAARAFRRRIALAHCNLLAHLLAPDGAVLFASDRVGYLLPPRAGPHAHDGAEALAVLPDDALAVPDDLRARFALVGPVESWSWLVTQPDATNPGRRYETFGAVLRALPAAHALGR